MLNFLAEAQSRWLLRGLVFSQTFFAKVSREGTKALSHSDTFLSLKFLSTLRLRYAKFAKILLVNLMFRTLLSIILALTLFLTLLTLRLHFANFS